MRDTIGPFPTLGSRPVHCLVRSWFLFGLQVGCAEAMEWKFQEWDDGLRIRSVKDSTMYVRAKPQKKSCIAYENSHPVHSRVLVRAVR